MPGYRQYEELNKKEPQLGDRVFMKHMNVGGEIVGIDDDRPSTMYQIALDNHSVVECNKASFVLVP